MTTHAINAPSGSHGWMQCPGWQASADDSEYSAEGTAAHFLASHCLHTGEQPVQHVKRRVGVARSGAYWLDDGDEAAPDHYTFVIDDEMVEAIGRYCELVRDFIANPPTLAYGIERHVDMSSVVPDCHGTADAIVVSQQRIVVIDLKYGRGFKVHAERNPQLMLYALGAYLEYGLVFDGIEYATVIIAQPRLDHIDEWTCSIDELRAFGNEAGTAARRRSSLRLGPLTPGEEQCRWCAHAATCPALATHVQTVLTADFDDLTQRAEAVFDAIPQLPPERLALAMRAVPLIEHWCRAVRADVERRLLVHEAVPGFKLVTGRQGPRKWTDPGEVERMLKAMRLRQEEMYDMALISPTTAEKLATKQLIGERQWIKLQRYVARTNGAPSVAPDDDPRPAITMASADDFSDLTQPGPGQPEQPEQPALPALAGASAGDGITFSDLL